MHAGATPSYFDEGYSYDGYDIDDEDDNSTGTSREVRAVSAPIAGSDIGASRVVRGVRTSSGAAAAAGAAAAGAGSCRDGSGGGGGRMGVPPRWPALAEEHLSRLYSNDDGCRPW